MPTDDSDAKEETGPQQAIPPSEEDYALSTAEMVEEGDVEKGEDEWCVLSSFEPDPTQFCDVLRN